MRKIRRVIKICEMCGKPALGIYSKDGSLETAYIIEDEQSLGSLKLFMHYASGIQINCNVDFEFECPI